MGALLFAILFVAGWYWYLANAASSNPDPSGGGAYCAFFMLTAPIAAFLGVLVGAFVEFCLLRR